METLFFSDIEGSTRLWEEHSEEMARALARHDEILTKAVEGSRGEILKNTGDGMIAVFPDADAGMAAAIHVQTALSAEQWASIEPIKVRIGIHNGETEQRDGDHFGRAMNRASRIMSAAHGGQVLVSESVVSQVDQLPPDTSLLDLGMHRLRDLSSPEHLFQLVHDGLRNDFPPLRSLDGRPNNLPLQTTDFLGRTDELAAIRVMLDSPGTRLLTLTGPGGTGKTRLALQVAAEKLDDFPDGVFFVDLSAERSPDGVYEAIVRTLDLPATGGGSPLNMLSARLRDKTLLLVLDNFEQVTAAATGLVGLLQAVPKVTILVTSRETLRVRPEHVFPVPPLPVPHPNWTPDEIADSDAVRLFVDRARAIRPDFALTGDNARTVAQITLRLDGLPLAIELAAARLNVFSPDELLARIQDRLEVLGAGGRDLPDRQRTLWGAIGWSYELLDDSERVLFETMSVFNSATLAALESVTGTPDVVDTVASLVDKSLVRVDEQSQPRRFSMLVMIKEYAASRLSMDAERRMEARAAHAAYFCEQVEVLRGQLNEEDREEALARIELDLPDIASAWAYRVETKDVEGLASVVDGVWGLLEAKGWYRTAIEVATDAIELIGDSNPQKDLTLRTARARALMAVHGYTEEVEEEFQKALLVSDITGSPSERAPVIRALATYYMGISRFDQSAEYGRRLLALGEESGDVAIQVDGHYVLGVAVAFTGNPEEGMPHLERAIELHDPRIHHSTRFRLGPNTGVTARVASGLLLWQFGDLEVSVERLGEALRVARSMDHPYTLAYGLFHNGLFALLRGRIDEMADFARELQDVSSENDYVVWQTLATVLEGVGQALTGDGAAGLAKTETGVRLYRGTSAPPIFWPQILGLRATVHACAGEFERALELAYEAADLGAIGDDQDPDLLIVAGDVLSMWGKPAEAESVYEKSAQGGAGAGLRLIELRALTRLVETRRFLGIDPDGSDELRDVYNRFTQGFDENDLVRARGVLDS